MTQRNLWVVPALLFFTACSDSSTDPTESADDSPTPELSCSIPVNEIFSALVGTDEIPSLSFPAIGPPGVTPAGMADTDRVLGIVVNGAARAYPFPVMWWHEVVNDTLGGEPVLVSYCPLTGTGLAFDPRIDGDVRSFGVSGVLYRTNLIMFDRETRSLWTQMLLGSQCGPDRGRGLDRVPVVETTLRYWKRLHPNTTVLTAETGLNRDLSQYPYGDYRALDNEQVPFLAQDVTWNKRLPAKELVLGVIDGWVTGQPCRAFAGCDAIAYPLSRLSELGAAAAVNDSVGGRAVLVTYQSWGEVAMAFDRTVAGQTLTFEVADIFPMTLTDPETGSTWDDQGVAMAGALEGARLEPIVDSYIGFWFAWSLHHGNLRLWE